MELSRSSKNLLFSGITLLIVFSVSDAMFFAGGLLLQSKWSMWTVPKAPEGRKDSPTFDEYMSIRHPVLGWPSPTQFGVDFDINGAQHNPFFPEDAKTNESCVSLYGDSFTYGGDTSGLEQNWGNLLSKELNCYVANYGMWGYGTDQAYIRLIENDEDISPVTILGFHTADTLRNLTRIRDLENQSKDYALKPRFTMDSTSGELTLVPIPNLSEDEYLRMTGAQGEIIVLEHENFQPGGPAGVVKLEFPYMISVTRNLIHYYGFHARLFEEPEWLRFLQPGHPLQGLEITIAITRDFVDLARNRNKQPLVLILPHLNDFVYFQETGEWPYRNVVDGYNELEIPFEDFGPRLLAEAKKEKRSIATYFGHTAHYNDDGNEVLATFAKAMLLKRKLILESVTP